MQDTIKRIIDKILSGRFILTVLCGIAFVWCVITRQLAEATITAILLAVFNSYFDRKDRNGKPPNMG